VQHARHGCDRPGILVEPSLEALEALLGENDVVVHEENSPGPEPPEGGIPGARRTSIVAVGNDADAGEFAECLRAVVGRALVHDEDVTCRNRSLSENRPNAVSKALGPIVVHHAHGERAIGHDDPGFRIRVQVGRAKGVFPSQARRLSRRIPFSSSASDPG
jgi:hypothetical protein